MDIDITVKEARESKIEDGGELGDIKKEQTDDRKEKIWIDEENM